MAPLPDHVQDTLLVRFFGLTKIPLLFFIGPSVIRMDQEVCTIKIPLNFRTKNHLGSMYFATLCAGADCAAGLMPYKLAKELGRSVSLSFKSFQADFIKRAHHDTYFRCTQGKEIRGFVEEVVNSRERKNLSLKVEAYVMENKQEVPVAMFTIDLSMKKK
jgi:acyl-coenzyme A thioesterase PaaI-like protein